MNKKDLLIISGPTAVGKTDISIKLAQRLNGEIVSADSMQIYKHMDIGSAKVSPEEMGGIPHHLIDIILPSESFSAAQYKTEALKAIDDILERGKYPLLVGGTGLYIDSVICDYNFTDADKDPDYRKELEKLAAEKGREWVHGLLKDVDYATYIRLHPNNLKRVIRALEVHKLTGKPFSEFEDENSKYKAPYDIHYFVLTMDRDKLYERINRRVDIMLQKGLLEEVRSLKEAGYTVDMQSMKGIGYKEILNYLDNLISYEEAVNMIKQGSRNYAKRQLTWFRRDPRVHWIDKDEFSSDNEIVHYILNKL